jgi:hypothetical protein
MNRYPWKAVLTAVLVLGLTLIATPAEPPKATVEAPKPAEAPRSPVGFIKGYTWGWNSQRGDYLGDAAAESMKRLAETGTQWITIAYMCHMPAWNKPEILWGEKDPTMVTDDEIRRAAKLARELKLKIILKPVVDLSPGAPAGQWRGTIDFTTADGKPDQAAWDAWWKNYRAYILHHAALAQEIRAELFCIGCEMKTTERFEQQWRDLIAAVRRAYKGPLVYNGVLETMWFVRWWDAVDILGVSAYSWHPDQTDASVEAQTAHWTKWRDNFRLLVAKFKKPVLFIEMGCRSARGAAAMSGDFTHWEWPYDGQEQANFYEAAFRVFWDEPWFCGYSWWDWKVKLYKKEDAEKNKEFCIYGKPAEQVLRTWYAKPRP